MSTQVLRLTARGYDIERALSGELRKSAPNPLRIFRLRRAKAAIRARFERLFRR